LSNTREKCALLSYYVLAARCHQGATPAAAGRQASLLDRVHRSYRLPMHKIVVAKWLANEEH
jgi:hypothetical protein